MFRQIVVGVDEHEGGRDAIALARNLLGPGGDLTLAHISPHGERSYRGAPAAHEHASGMGLLEKAREDAGVDAHLRCSVSASVGRGLHKLSEAIGADLITVGSSRRGLLGRVVIGDDTQAAVHGAPCAIAIAPANYSHEPVDMGAIGIGYDGSPESEHALELARGFAAETGAKLSAFEAILLPAEVFNASRSLEAAAIDAAVKEARERIFALGGIEPHAGYGHPAKELAAYTASLDLLIVGSRDYGPIGRLIHGSTSQQLAHTARCPLLVVPRFAHATRAGSSSPSHA